MSTKSSIMVIVCVLPVAVIGNCRKMDSKIIIICGDDGDESAAAAVKMNFHVLQIVKL